MSAGNRTYIFRAEKELQIRIEAALASRNETSKEELMTVSDWIRKAINEKLDHLERSKRSKSKKEVPPSFVEDVIASLDKTPDARGQQAE